MYRSVIAIYLVTPLLLLACNLAPPPTPTSAPLPSIVPSSEAAIAGEDQSVSMNDLAFDPPSTSVRIGQSVTWTNKDSTAHTVKDDGNAWGSENLEPDATFTHLFTQPGRFPYHCSIHPDMKATVLVVQ